MIRVCGNTETSSNTSYFRNKLNTLACIQGCILLCVGGSGAPENTGADSSDLWPSALVSVIFINTALRHDSVRTQIASRWPGGTAIRNAGLCIRCRLKHFHKRSRFVCVCVCSCCTRAWPRDDACVYSKQFPICGVRVLDNIQFN